MQNKGIVIVTAVLLTLASIFYLSFSAATSYFDKQAAKMFKGKDCGLSKREGWTIEKNAKVK